MLLVDATSHEDWNAEHAEPWDIPSFAVVRNPWDRLVANWKMWSGSRYDDLMLMRCDAPVGSFKEFLDFALNFRNHHWAPCSLFIPESVNYIIRFEYLAADMAHMSIRSGIHGYLWHLKVTPPSGNPCKAPPDHMDYRRFYTNTMRKAVAREYRDDIQRFGYRF
jgi:hypothetical protein